MIAVEEILQAPNLRELIDELETAWIAEQKRRHEFWAEIDENIKAEFIMGEIIYHSPIYGRHWKASTRISRKLIPYVYDQDLGEIAYEKVMVRLTRNDYEPDICFGGKNEHLILDKNNRLFLRPILLLKFCQIVPKIEITV